MAEEMARNRPLSADDIADWFINAVDHDAGDVITPRAVQKMIFFAQAWYLANTGRPLFAEEFEAWATGPICPQVFKRFENFSYTNIPRMGFVRVVKGDKLEVLEGVHARYGSLDIESLEYLVQEASGPWEAARGPLAPEAASQNVITKEEIKQFYGEKIGKHWA